MGGKRTFGTVTRANETFSRIFPWLACVGCGADALPVFAHRRLNRPDFGDSLLASNDSVEVEAPVATALGGKRTLGRRVGSDYRSACNPP